MKPIAYWREAFPEIAWDDPVVIKVAAQEGMVLVYACRVCIANHGIAAKSIIDGADVAAWEQPDEFIEHMATVHAT